MNKRNQIHAEIGWLAKHAELCSACPNRANCRYRDKESGVGIANRNEKIVYATQWLEGALGYAESELNGMSTRDVTAPFSWPLHLYQRECVKQFGYADFRKWLRTKNGRLIATHCSVRKDYERGEPVYICFNSLMCPVIREAEDFRPVQYPRLVAVK